MAQIMIVEDNQGTNKAICEYLKTAGHTLFPALDGEEALNIFRDNSIDLAVLDIMLPKMSGVTILHEIRKISNIPVVMLTAVDDEYSQCVTPTNADGGCSCNNFFISRMC